MTLNLAINGMGRIGRLIIRSLFSQNKQKDINLVTVNDVSGVESLAHLLTYDSVHGKWDKSVEVVDGDLYVEGHKIKVQSSRNIADLDFSGVDLVMECTGKFADKDLAKAHLESGAKLVLISAPAKNVDATVVYGVNHTVLDTNATVISNASCTTNCLAPVVYSLHEAFGVDCGIMTTIHALTSDQNLTDASHSDIRRARMATASMIPTKTGAAKAIGLVIPSLSGKLKGMAVRVPTSNVSLVDVTLSLSKQVSEQDVAEALIKSSKEGLKGVMDVTTLPLVSVDYNGSSYSSVVDINETIVCGNMVKLLAWYDNEYGFACRMLDTALYFAQVHGIKI